jgi:hypothetical protein
MALMKILILLSFALFSSAVLNADSPEVDIRGITESEAMAIVKAREEAREAALDQKEAELLNADIKETAIADLGYQKVILNRVAVEKPVQPKSQHMESQEADLDESAFFSPDTRERINLTLSGTVRDGISELWWRHGENDFKVFTNANFLWFNTFEERIEDEDTIYSIFPIIAKGHSYPELEANSDQWYPTQADFTPGQIEYYVVKSSGIEAVDTEALKPLRLMLEFYRDNVGRMKVSYENAEKMRIARDAYLEANPRKKRDVIINSAPIDKSNR